MTSTRSKSRFQEWKKARESGIKEFRFALSRIGKSPLSLIGSFIIIFFAIMAISAPFLAPQNPSWDIDHIPNPFIIPRATRNPYPTPLTLDHPLGMTNAGYDIYYGIVWGSITAFRIGAVVVVISLAIGLTVGLTAGFYGGLIDEVLMRFTDIIICFPSLIFAMALIVALPNNLSLSMIVVLIPLAAFLLILSVTGFLSREKLTRNLLLTAITCALLATVALVLVGAIPGMTILTMNLTRLDKVIIALVLTGWPGYTRVIRGEVLRARSEDYVEAAKAVGCSDIRIITRHIVPNTIYPILILASLDIGSIVLLAAGLSFLGLGADPNYADWGQLIQQAQDFMGSAQTLVMYWFIWLIPGAFIFMFSLGWNLLGDAVRDILDPTLRRR